MQACDHTLIAEPQMRLTRLCHLHIFSDGLRQVSDFHKHGDVQVLRAAGRHLRHRHLTHSRGQP